MSFYKRFLRRSSIYKKVFGTDDGQDVLRFLAEEAGQFRTSHVPEDPYATAFNEGKRQMFNHIMGVLNQSEEVIRKAIQQEQEMMHLQQTLNGMEN